jgi:hypothetical protein
LLKRLHAVAQGGSRYFQVIRRFPKTTVLDYREKDRQFVNFIALELHVDLRRLVWRCFATGLKGSSSFGATQRPHAALPARILQR